MSEGNVHHQTRRGADLALAKKQISRDSHKAIMEGTLSLEEARELGREGSPFGPAPKPVSKNDRRRPCIACGGMTKGGRFHPGCDAKMHRIADEHLRGERELTDEQREYLETSGKMEQARKRAEREEAQDSKRWEKEAKK